VAGGQYQQHITGVTKRSKGLFVFYIKISATRIFLIASAQYTRNCYAPVTRKLVCTGQYAMYAQIQRIVNVYLDSKLTVLCPMLDLAKAAAL
jgi:hypothetical protein